ncbi:tRNA pseudouridine(13) synthase TruD [Exilibacterium tricleocarpae]|uniref:tRNA pseudouridine synthase D n=1 Tax=Exilibacterium tricleocarpae TaxID=2591008 RepID=A0A545U568_9GAMM|nr:tRNA pseudouridine(13) synthase TruD [Exilibacterium tricleocarpae]TQV84604.1 tRNA pseudouridine(13) synthase TruD [Exilibacterium tricleocarpae]
MNDFFLDFPRIGGEPPVRAVFRARPEDFWVDEELGWEPDGSGEHAYLHIEKRGANTAWVAARLAELAGVRGLDVGYCGLKDRHAVTRQWFSVYLAAAAEPRWHDLPAGLTVLAQTRHRSKLRRGQHRRNHFVVCLRQLRGETQALEARLRHLADDGCPNYFGEQRFGRQGDNLRRAERLLVDRAAAGRDRHQRGLLLSAARAYLFNLVLAQRVSDGSWNILLDGEAAVDGQPTAPLWGRGRAPATGAASALEQRALADWHGWCHGLEHTGLKQARRVTVLRPQQFRWRWLEADLQLEFALAPGEFATSLLREIAVLES